MTLKDWLDNFSEQLVELMDDYEMTQQDLAEKSGLSVGSINAYIRKQTLPGVKALVNIADVFEISIDELMDFGDTID
jgi:transcriptional regulator with XRE-family HTH domain